MTVLDLVPLWPSQLLTCPTLNTAEVDYDTNYSFGGRPDPSRLLTIAEATSTLETSLQHVDDTIQTIRADSTLTKEQKSNKYLDTCRHDIRLAHEVMTTGCFIKVL